MVLTGRAAALAAVGALVVAVAAPSAVGVLIVTGVVLALACIDIAFAGAVRPLALRHGGDESVRLGQTARVILQLANDGRRVRGTVRNAWPPSAGLVDDRAALDIGPGERRRLEFTLRPSRRGDRAAHRVIVRSIGPLGLAGRQGSHAVPWTLRVLPPFHSRRHLPSRLARLRELDGRAAVHVRGAGTEFDSLREYVIGDDTRSIDWRATARGGEVVVRTWRPERDRHVLIVLDTGRTSAGRVGDAPRLDAAMDAALLLAALATRAGDRVDLLAYDRQARASVEKSAPAEVLPRFVNAMATLEPELLETDHRRLVAEVLRRARRHSLIVLLTGLDAGPVEDALLPTLGSVTPRHTVLVASVADPRVAEMARARGETDAVYGAAAAERDRMGRARASRLLERHGAHVVDAAPDELPPAVADAYLALKAAGQL
ncbi:MAG: DUF58 domain-containing protein [Propionibacteriales bacterium]|nr:DUF58 domain-containing protein [Propionibacteriales bacterium]